MSLSSKSSRRNSLSSLFNLGNNADNAQHERNLHDDEQHHASGSNEEGPPHAEHSNHNRRNSNKNDEDDIEPPRYLTYTQNHPMGRLFLALFRENVKNSKKELDLNIEDLCCDFYHAMQLERDNTHRTVQQAARGIGPQSNKNLTVYDNSQLDQNLGVQERMERWISSNF